MLTHEQLVDLYRALRQEKVLSVYLDVDQHDPAERNTWRIRLEQEVNQRRKELDGDDGERRRFEKAWLRLRKELGDFEAFVPERGWVGFATPDQVWYAENVPVPMSDGVYWEEGIRVAPYVRGLKQDRPVITVLLDSQRARLFRYRGGEVTELEDVRADTFLGEPADVNVSKRAAVHSGVRGETGTELAQRVLDVSSERMLKHVVEAAVALAGSHGFLALGGVPETVSRAAQAFPKNVHSRLTEVASLYLEMPQPEVKKAVERAASLLTRRHQEDLLEQVVNEARAGGRACLGRADTERALQGMRVETLLLSRTFTRDELDFADHCVGAAFAQGAAVEELSDVGAARLDREGGGVGARLRYRVPGQGNGQRPEQQTAGDESGGH